MTICLRDIFFYFEGFHNFYPSFGDVAVSSSLSDTEDSLQTCSNIWWKNINPLELNQLKHKQWHEVFDKIIRGGIEAAGIFMYQQENQLSCHLISPFYDLNIYFGFVHEYITLFQAFQDRHHLFCIDLVTVFFYF